MIAYELKLVCIYFAIGILIGLIYDVFRSLRRSMKTSDKLTNIEDIIFISIIFIIVTLAMFKFNNFKIRFYLFTSIAIGILFYYFTGSKFIMKANITILSYIKKFVKNICIFIKSLL